MPELPEVEFVARALNKLLTSRSIVSAELRRERLAPDTTPEEFAAEVSGGVNRVYRRGKHVLFDLDTGRTLITHLRMSGRFMILAPESDDPKFTHASFYLNDETRLIFQDQRHFGMMKVVRSDVLHEAKELRKLAPEPFSDEFSKGYLLSTLKDSNRSLKEFLIDQTKVCGLGNIYATEAMFLARIHPATPASRITARKAGILHDKIREVLDEAITHSEVAEIDPENLERAYYSGGYDTGWHVYGREKMPCRHCNTLIVRLRQGGRSTYYCSKCQRR